MITLGLVRELYFISHVLKTDISFEISSSSLQRILTLKIRDKTLNVWYGGVHIWREVIEGESSFFGIESCDTISRIIACINNNSPWDQYRWQDSLDEITNTK